MSKAKATVAKRPITPKQRKAIGTAYGLGLSTRAAFQAGVSALSVFSKEDTAGLIEFGLAYKAGNMASYFATKQGANWKRRNGNKSAEMIQEDMLAIYAKPYPESTKPNRRTDEQHKACRAADNSWCRLKAEAGLTVPTKRKARPAANKAEPPRSLVTAVPTFTDKAAANDHFGQAAAALLATVNANARKVSPQVSSAISDFHKALKAAGLIVDLAK